MFTIGLTSTIQNIKASHGCLNETLILIQSYSAFEIASHKITITLDMSTNNRKNQIVIDSMVTMQIVLESENVPFIFVFICF